MVMWQLRIMIEHLNSLPDLVNKIFDVLDLLTVRALLLILIILGARSLIKRHS